jgi:hypothetical protein
LVLRLRGGMQICIKMLASKHIAWKDMNCGQWSSTWMVDCRRTSLSPD